MIVVVGKPRGATADGADPKKPLKGVRVTLESDDPKAMRALKSGKKIYLFVAEDGGITSIAGLFDGDLTPDVYKAADESRFTDRAIHIYDVAADPNLKGSRLDPTFMEISSVDADDDKATVKGALHNARDARLPWLDRSEKTDFGTGRFTLDSVVALYDGGYFNAALSPDASEIAAVVEEQKKLFKQYQLDEDPDTKEALENTRRLLKPHALEVFAAENDMVSFVTKTGRWQTIMIAGNRKLDVWDRDRIYRFADTWGLVDDVAAMRAARESFYRKPMQERFDLEDLVPVLIEEVLAQREKDVAEIEARVKASKTAKPSDGLDAVPGLREGVQFLPHQAYIGAMISDRDRMAIDADPGAGKTLLIVADVLRQIAKDRVRRPIVIMPNSLVSQFAQEVRHFSELNPWIINTDSVRRWSRAGDKDEKLSRMLESAKAAPENTLFITSYHFIAAARKSVDNGAVLNKGGRQVYGKTKTYPNAYRILAELGIDAVYFDEVHTLKNNSSFTKAASAFAKAKQVKGFTGTVFPGNLADVLGMMGVIHSAVMGSNEEFVREYSPTKSLNSYRDAAPKEIRQRLKRFGMPMVRSTAWGAVMPGVHRQYHFVQFSERQKKFYDALLKNSLDEIKADEKLTEYFRRFGLRLEEGQALMNPALRARLTPLEVFLNSPAEASKWLGATLTGDDAVSPKVKEIDAICSKHLADPSNGKVIVFVQHKAAGKNILKHLGANLRGQAEYYEGGMVDVLSRFKNPDSNLKILIGVDSTLRTGHNLQVANCVIHADTLWLSGDMRQREARANRIKQTRDVFVHHVVCQDSHELLKNARLLTQEHTIAKANSDFDDDTMLQHVEMTMDGMQEFRSVERLEPLIQRQKKIEDFARRETEVEKEFYGTRVMAPRAYESIAIGKRLAVVPSTKTFQGNLNDATYMVEEELSTMKWQADAPKSVPFHLQTWDDQWFLTAFKAADPNGFLRRLRFMLQPAYYYRETSKGGVGSVIDDLEGAGFEILNKAKLEDGAAKARLLHPARVGMMRRLEQESRKVAAASPKWQAEFYFATLDRKIPLVMSDNVKVGSKEGQALRRIGFIEGAPFWYLPVRRGTLPAFFGDVRANYPDLKVENWDAIKKIAKETWGVDLSEFDDMGEK